jgi:hypothetical protein
VVGRQSHRGLGVRREHVRACTHKHARMRTHMHTDTHTNTCSNTHAHTHSDTHTHANTCTHGVTHTQGPACSARLSGLLRRSLVGAVHPNVVRHKVHLAAGLLVQEHHGLDTRGPRGQQPVSDCLQGQSAVAAAHGGQGITQASRTEGDVSVS